MRKLDSGVNKFYILTWSTIMRKFSKSILAGILALVSLVVSNSHAALVDCQKLTPTAYNNAIREINSSLTQATLDFNKHGTTGAYAVAAKYNRDNIQTALGTMQQLINWLQLNNFFAPYVSIASASYNTYGQANVAIGHLHAAKHWATISAVYHGSLAARKSIDYSTRAISALEFLNINGTKCYVDQYGPFVN
jgi:hypothetical protein